MLKPIVLVEDNPHDLELTLVALERSQLANDVVVLRDGAEAVDYLLRRGAYAGREPGNPAVMLLDLKICPRSMAWKCSNWSAIPRSCAASPW
ncbi:CheY-like chemotaxis protein [Pseudomonas psychrotolerans]|nr:CheY-like chemotaxis protein [Pseudomonas psychrotolerans]